MIGIVVVSHSAQLARAAVALASEMVEADQLPTVQIAAGLDESTFGTDAAAIAEALGAADSGDGVLVLLDLGSAIMSTEMAVEFLEPDVAERVAISSAPLVEGLVAAVVTAASRTSLEDVRTEAERGLAGKQDHLGAGAGAGAGASDGTSDPGEGQGANEGEHRSDRSGASGFPSHLQGQIVSRQMRVDIEHGLHARPAARLISRVKRFTEARVRLRNLDGADGFVDAGSLSAVATLNIGQGDRIEVQAAGGQATEVLDALTELANAGFDDTSEREVIASAAPDKTGATPEGTDPGADPSVARGADSGSAMATAVASVGSGLEAAIGVITRPADGRAEDYLASGEAGIEHARLSDALASALTQLQTLALATRSDVGGEQAQIFEAHQALLEDAAMVQPAQLAIDEGHPAAAAWQQAGDSVARQFEELNDEYQRERAQDVRSVTDRVLRLLVDASRRADQHPDEDQSEDRGQGGSEHGQLQSDQPGNERASDGQGGGAVILIVPELDPGTAATLDAQQVAGILCTSGGATGHGVIIAAARGIPMMTGVTEVTDVIEGSTVAFDARRRTVLINPSPTQQSDFEQMLADRTAQQIEDRAAATEPGRTSDGHLVAVLANVTSAEQAQQAVELGAEGSGLVRTEVMFESWSSMPTVAEQVAQFTQVARALDGAAMTIRTWDIGADKPLAFWKQATEQNPFLGVRGLRSFWGHPGPLRDQLSAVCQVAHDHPVAVMFPMVSTVEEVTWALEQLDAVCDDLPAGRPAGLRVGVMIEVPAASLRAGPMTAGLDFVSIGTNDLTQYVMAAERGNPDVADLFDTMDPAVLSLIARVCDEVADDVAVGVCGAAASDPLTAALLVGLGVHELSASPVAVPRVKSILRQHSHEELRALGAAALDCESAEQVRQLLGTRLGDN